MTLDEFRQKYPRPWRACGDAIYEADATGKTGSPVVQIHARFEDDGDGHLDDASTLEFADPVIERLVEDIPAMVDLISTVAAGGHEGAREMLSRIFRS